MGFELSVKSNTPLTGESDKDIVSKIFLEHIGYITKGSEPDIPMKLFIECFLMQPEKPWIAEEMAVKLETSIPTIYRHLNKLKSLDILEEVKLEDPDSKQVKKGYRLRYGNLSKAWTFVEAHVDAAMENYRKTIDHIQSIFEAERKAGTSAKKASGKGKK
jgi:predicted transcriptional regulator